MTGSLDLSGLSDRQRAIATTLDAPLFVEAGAGSGKTFTLTQRIAWALSPGSGADGAPFLESLDQVLVITFTEAAAREIKERVRATLRSAGLAEQALAVDDAWISTIHGMCSRILHRHALDLRLDPEFSVVVDSAQAELFDRAMDDVMRSARSDEAFSALLGTYELGTRSAWGGYTKTMGLVEALVHAGASCPGGVAALRSAPSSRDALDEAVAAFAARMEELGACDLTDAAERILAPELEALRGFLRHPARGRTPGAIAQQLGAITFPRSSRTIKEELAAAKAARALALAEARFVEVAPLADALLELARRVEQRYRDLKDASCCLDNDDLIREALRAVRDNEGVRRDYAGRFRLVMVDEFQDTDELQLELISLLAGKGGAHLCTVGDAQQSIYRFRGADVGVFRRHGERVGPSRTVRLDTNYRSHADVLAFVERVCTGGDGPAPGVLEGFMHLDACPTRRDGYGAPGLPRIDVEVCSGSASSGRPTRHHVATMAAQLADALASYRAAGERAGNMALLLGVTTNADLYIDAIRARGMECVVTGGSTFSSTDEVRVVCALLHVLANPSDTQSGLFPLLASEMFGLDANDFCELGTRAQDGFDTPAKRGIDRGLASMEFYDGAEPSLRLTRAHEVLARALEQVAWRPVADICADVVRDSGWLARLEAGGAQGRARAANVLAAVRYVRDLTESLGLGAARAATEFDAWLAVAKVPPASLAGEDGAAGDGTVRVMTIHASKGLEFGVCAVAECWTRSSSAPGVALGPREQGGRAVVLRPPDDGEGKSLSAQLKLIDPEELEPSAGQDEPAPLAARYLALGAAGEQADAHERARLLYVAMTRAREALVLGISAAAGKDGVPASPLAAGTLEALLGTAAAPEPGIREVDYGGSAPARLRCVEVSVGRGKDKQPPSAQAAGTLAGFGGELPAQPADVVRLGTTEEDTASEQGPVPFDLFELALPAAPPTGARAAREGVFSYSSVHAALAAPSRPTSTQRAAQASGEPQTGDADRATNLGSAFHELAQAMVESGGPVGEGLIEAQIRRWRLSDRAAARLREALARWERSALRSEALAWPLVRAEVSFFQRVDSPHGNYLEGAMDLLCTDKQRRAALVVDYKTGDRGLGLEEVRERHAMQAEFYAGVLLDEGFDRVECAFVCVEREDEQRPGEPLSVRYTFDQASRSGRSHARP